MENVFHYWSFVREVTERIPIRRAKSVVFWYFLKRQHGPRCITNVMLVVISDVHMWIKSTSFNVWVGHFVWNFKGTLLNSTHNILPIQWKIWFLYNTEPLRALRFKSSNAFFAPPPPRTPWQMVIPILFPGLRPILFNCIIYINKVSNDFKRRLVE